MWPLDPLFPTGKLNKHPKVGGLVARNHLAEIQAFQSGHGCHGYDACSSRSGALCRAQLSVFSKGIKEGLWPSLVFRVSEAVRKVVVVVGTTPLRVPPIFGASRALAGL